MSLLESVISNYLWLTMSEIWIICETVLLLALQVQNVLCIIGSYDIRDYWKEYTKSEIEDACGNTKL